MRPQDQSKKRPVPPGAFSLYMHLDICYAYAMINSLKQQNGFAHVTLLIIMVIALVGGAGYYVWSQQQDSVTKTSSNPQPEGPEPKTTIITKATTYILPKTGLAVSVPKGWEIKETTDDQSRDGIDDVFYTAIKKGDWTVYLRADYGGKGGPPTCNDPNEPAYYDSTLDTCPTGKIVTAKPLVANACLIDIDITYPDGLQKRITKYDGPYPSVTDAFDCSSRDLGVFDDGWGQLSDLAVPNGSEEKNIPAQFGGSIHLGSDDQFDTGLIPIESLDDATYKEAVAILSSLSE